MRISGAKSVAWAIGSLLTMSMPVVAQQANQFGAPNLEDPSNGSGQLGHAKRVPAAGHAQVAQSGVPKAKTAPEPSVVPNAAGTPLAGKERETEGSGTGSATVNPAGDFQPVIHARGANITTCMDRIVTQSNDIIDRPHTAISRWVQSAPNEHAFESIVGLTNPSKIAPSALAVIVAAPLNGSRCEGETIQIYPTAQPCGTVQASLIRSGRTVGALQSMPVIDTDDGARIVLLPNGGSGCVLVRMRTS